MLLFGVDIMAILALVVGIVSLVCWIWTIVVLIKGGHTALGICGICPLVALIGGWLKATELNHTTVMLVWSVCVVLNIVLNFAMAA